MKTDALSSVLNPNLIVLGVLAGAVLVVTLTGTKVPLLSNLRISLIVFVVLGMAMCTSGIGRVAATGQWTHPLSILGYVLGALVLAIATAAFFSVKLPLVADGKQAFVAMATLTAAKVLNSVLHSLIGRR
jgi:hypothetical protein